MKRNCTVLVLILAILLCVGCSNPSDKVEENIPSIDANVPSSNDMMATPADVLRNITKAHDYTTATKSRSISSTSSEADNSDIYDYNSNIIYKVEPFQPDKIFNIILSNEIAPLMEKENVGFVNKITDPGFSVPKFTDFTKESVEAMTSPGEWRRSSRKGGTVYETYEQFLEAKKQEYLKDVEIKNVKVMKNPNDNKQSIVYYTARLGEAQLYCILICTQNEYFPVFDTELICSYMGTPVNASTEYSPTEMTACGNMYMPMPADNAELNEKLQYVAIMQTKIINNSEGTKSYRMDLGQMNAITFRDNEQNGYGSVNQIDESYMSSEIFNEVDKVYYVNFDNKNLIPDASGKYKYSGSRIPNGSYSVLTELTESTLNGKSGADVIMKYKDKVAECAEELVSDIFSDNFNGLELTENKLDMLKAWIEVPNNEPPEIPSKEDQGTTGPEHTDK